jgi:hypothetical protein
MTQERKQEKLKDDRGKWDIFFDMDSNFPKSESVIDVRFRKINDSPYLKKEDIEKLKKDLKDLGKFRIIKQGKEFLEK